MALPDIHLLNPGYVYIESATNISYIVNEYLDINNNTVKVWDINKANAGAALEVDVMPIASLSYFGT